MKMRRSVRAAAAVLPLNAALVASAPSGNGVELLATGRVPSDARDRSGLMDVLRGDGSRAAVPHDQLGSFGSAIAYTGRGELYIACDDRGPWDGAADFACRFHEFRISVRREAGNGAWGMEVVCEETRLLRRGDGERFVGALRAFSSGEAERSMRLDPEGVRVLPDGSVIVSDEYGPWVDVFDRSGEHRLRMAPPAGFRNNAEADSPALELPPRGVEGRQPNRGMEGLAVAPDGMRAYGLMQSPLIQDGALDGANKRIGVNARIVEYSLRAGAEGARRQFVYPMSHASSSLNEICAVSDRTFLVIERDGKGGEQAKFRAIMKIVLDGATDVSDRARIDPREVGKAIHAVQKSVLIDLMDPAFGLAGASMPEKIEGLTFGPTLADGRLLLLVSSDNDFIPRNDSVIWAFAIDPALLPDYQAPLQ